MVRLHLSYTAPINPPSASPTLTPSQIWAGLQRKIRFAQEFVPVIESCEVLSDKDGVVDRFVKFKAGKGPKDQARETVRSYWPSWVDFEQEDGTHIRNVISDGDGFGHDALHMTYVFEFDLPNIQEGDAEATEKERKRLQAMSKQAVESSIDTIREMVKDGRIIE